MLITVFAAVAGVIIQPTDLQDVDRVAALCKSATEAQTETNSLRAWLKTIDDASESGRLTPDQRRELFKMCAMYSAGKRDAAQDDLDATAKQLRDNAGELRQVLDRHPQ